MLPRIGFYIIPEVVPFFLPILRELPPDIVDVLTPNGFNSLANKGAIQIQEMGFNMLPVSPAENPIHSFLVTDAWILKNSDIFATHIEAGTRFLCLQHATDGTTNSTPNAHYNIRAHKMLTVCANKKKELITRDNDPELCDKICAYPPEAKEEFAYTGPYHIAEYWQKRHLPKHVLRQEMEEILGQRLPANKPVVACYLDEISHEGQLVDGLRKLSKHVTIIYKTFKSNDQHLTALGDAVIPWPSLAYAANALRFGADILVAGYNSGTLATSVMLGLRVLPFYTRIIHPSGRNTKERLLKSYTRRLPTAISLSTTSNCLLGLGKAYDIQDTGSILSAISDEEGWNEYEKRLPFTQRLAFGHYYLEDSARRTAMLILRAFRKGSFGQDTTSVRIRSEWFEKQGITVQLSREA